MDRAQLPQACREVGRSTCSRLSALRPAVSEEGGSWGRKSVSEVAMSLKGMPTIILAPSLR